MNLLISGGAGYLGSVLVQKLIAARTTWSCEEYQDHLRGPNIWSMPFDKITVYDNLRYKQIPLINYCYRGDFEFVNADVRDTERLKPYVEEADVIIPLAAIVGAPACDKDTLLATMVNTEQIENILKYKKPEAKIIYPNTNSGYGIGQDSIYCTEDTPLAPISHYGITKCAAEKMVLDAGGISLRLATVFGVSNRMRLDLLVNDFTYKAMTDGYIVLFEQDFKRNYIHIQDVALTFIHSIIKYNKMQGNAYNVGINTANLSKRELAEKIKEFIPNFSIQSDNIKEDVDKRNYIVSNDKLIATGWRNYYTLEMGIRELIKAYRIIIPSNNKYTNL